MTKGEKHIVTILCLVLVSAYSQAQVSVRSNIDRDNILIGEAISLTVEAYMPLGSNIVWFNSDTIPHFDITQKSGVDTSQGIDGRKMAQSFTITSFDSGQQYIPPFEILVDSQSYYTDSIPVMVSFAPFDSKDDYRDIKDIIEVNIPALKYVPWAMAAAVILSLALLAFGWHNRRLKPVHAVKERETALSPYEEAMKSLAQLSSHNTNNGEVKTYYSQMNDILRRYVSRKFSVSTFQKTNEELILEMSVFGIPKDAYISLAQSLRMSDSVKFAKYRPSDEDNRKNLQIVTSSIEILDKNAVSAV
jgi:hypothetical protein